MDQYAADHSNLDALGDNYGSAADATSDMIEQQVKAERRRRLLVYGGMGLALFAGVAALIWRHRQQQPSGRAEIALNDTARRLEETARLVRKQGPKFVERHARQAEALAHDLGRQSAELVASSGARIEAAGKAMRKRGPSMATNIADRLEAMARRLRKEGPDMLAAQAGRIEGSARMVRKDGHLTLRRGMQQANATIDQGRATGKVITDQAGRFVEQTRSVGGNVVSGAQQLIDGVRERVAA